MCDMCKLRLKHKTLSELLKDPIRIRLSVTPGRVKTVRERTKCDLRIRKALLGILIRFWFDEYGYETLDIPAYQSDVTAGSWKIGPVRFELDAELNVTKFELDRDEACGSRLVMREIWDLLRKRYPSEVESIFEQYTQEGDKLTTEELNRIALDLFEQKYLKETKNIRLVPQSVELEPIQLSHVVDALRTGSKVKREFFKFEDIKQAFEKIHEKLVELYAYREIQQVEPYEEVEHYVVSAKKGPWRLSATVSRMSNGSDELGHISLRLSYAGREFTGLTVLDDTYDFGLVMATSQIEPMLFSTKLFSDLARDREQIVLSCVNEKLVRQSDKYELCMYTGRDMCVKAVDKPCASLQEFLDRLTEPKETTAEVIAQWILESC